MQSCLCGLLYAALILSFLRRAPSFLLRFSHSLFVNTSSTQGCGCILKASVHAHAYTRTHQGGRFSCSTHTDNDLHFPSPHHSKAPVPMSVSSDQMGAFIRRFSLNAELREILVSHVTVSFLAQCVARPDSIRSTVTASSLPMNDTLHPPLPHAGWCGQVVSFVISIDESSPGESILSGGDNGVCILVTQPPQLAVPNHRLGCLTLPAAPWRTSTAEHRERWSSSKQLWCN